MAGRKRAKWLVPALAVFAIDSGRCRHCHVPAGRAAAPHRRSPIETDDEPARLHRHAGACADGRAVVYDSDSPAARVVAHQLAPGSAEMPLDERRRPNIQPAWSHDGQWIAFPRAVAAACGSCRRAGGTPQQVADFGSEFPRGHPMRNAGVPPDAGGLDGQSSLWTIRRDGSDRRALTKSAPPRVATAPPRGRNGRRVAFVLRSAAGSVDVWTVIVASGDTQLIRDLHQRQPIRVSRPATGAISLGRQHGDRQRPPVQARPDEAGSHRFHRRATPDGRRHRRGLSLAANGDYRLCGAHSSTRPCGPPDLGADGRGG